eukprot:COSAG04_NODE_4891_length_1841_cov_1.452928_2_plen_97_part_00
MGAGKGEGARLVVLAALGRVDVLAVAERRGLATEPEQQRGAAQHAAPPLPLGPTGSPPQSAQRLVTATASRCYSDAQSGCIIRRAPQYTPRGFLYF